MHEQLQRRFALLEVYRTEADTVKHKETAHYARGAVGI